MTQTHKHTNQKLLLKKNYGEVSIFYLLDCFGNKIQEGRNIHSEPYFKVGVCLNENVI